MTLLVNRGDQNGAHVSHDSAGCDESVTHAVCGNRDHAFSICNNDHWHVVDDDDF